MAHENPARFHELGLFTFPVIFDKTTEQKRPARPWRHEAMPLNPEPFGNYGVRLDASWLVVDVDTKNGKQGDESFRKLRALIGDPTDFDRTPRLIVQTMTGGRHHYFRKDPNITIAKNQKDFPDIDFLSEGDFVVGPGTDFKHRLEYGIQQGAVDNELIPLIPVEWATNLISRSREKRLPDRVFNNTSQSIEAFTDYCKRTTPAVEFARGNETTLSVALRGRDYGIDQDHALRIMAQHYNPRCRPEWDPGMLETIVANAYLYGKGQIGSQDYSHMFGGDVEQIEKDLNESVNGEGYRWHRSLKGLMKSNDETNTINYLVATPRGAWQNPLWNIFRYNAFNGRIEYVVDPPWFTPTYDIQNQNVPNHVDKYELGALKHFLFQTTEYVVERPVLSNAIEFVARRMTYHPVKGWLKGLVWDGVKRLDGWLPQYMDTEDTTYTRTIGAKVLLAAVSRIMNPGCKWDQVLILEGEQGTGKSRAVEALAVKPEWFASLELDTDKDTRAVLSRKWIIEFAEFDKIQSKDPAVVKAFVSNATDTYRPPYGEVPIDFQRQSIIIGTINPDGTNEYFNDSTGARRYWPVRCGAIDVEGLKRDVPQLYAEAMERYRQGEQLHVFDSLRGILEKEQEERRVTHPFEAILREYWANSAGALNEAQGLKYIAINVLNYPVERYTAKLKREIVTAAKAIGCRYNKELGTISKPDVGAFIDKNEAKWESANERIQHERAKLKEARRYSRGELFTMLNVKGRDHSAKVKLGQCLRECEGVQSYYSHANKEREYWLLPLECEV